MGRYTMHLNQKSQYCEDKFFFFKLVHKFIELSIKNLNRSFRDLTN